MPAVVPPSCCWALHAQTRQVPLSRVCACMPARGCHAVTHLHRHGRVLPQARGVAGGSPQERLCQPHSPNGQQGLHLAVVHRPLRPVAHLSHSTPRRLSRQRPEVSRAGPLWAPPCSNTAANATPGWPGSITSCLGCLFWGDPPRPGRAGCGWCPRYDWGTPGCGSG